MTALATIDDVEAVSRAVPDDDVAKVERLLEMVSAAVRTYTGQSFDPATESITIHPHDGKIRLPQRPVTAVSAVRINGNLVASNLYEFTANGYLTRKYPGWAFDYSDDLPWDGAGPYDPTGAPLDEWGWPTAPMTVTYSHGGDTPDDVVMVVAEVAATRWNSATANPLGVESSSETVAGYAHAETFRSRASLATAWEPAHKMILDRYRRSGLASVRVTR